MKKILYLYSDAGGCHKIAAEAIAETIDQKSKEKLAHKIIDMWTLGSKLQSSFFGEESYKRAMKYYPGLYGLGFWLVNNKVLSSLVSKLNYLSLGRGLRKLIKDDRPDLIVSTHPLVNYALIRTLKDLDLYGKIPTVNSELELVTVHHFWVEKGFDLTIVPTEEAKEIFIKRGYPPEKIKLVGFPVRQKFLNELPDKAILRKELGLSEDKFTVLIMGGIEGVGYIYEMVREAENINREIQLIVCAGKNTRLYDRLSNMKVGFPLKVYRYTEEIPKLMRASDLLLTKAGAASVSEAIASDLPMIIFSYVPGQESGTPKWVERNGFGKYVNRPKAIVKTINDWIENGKINELKKNISRFKNPKVTYDIVDLILSLFG